MVVVYTGNSTADHMKVATDAYHRGANDFIPKGTPFADI